MKNKKIFIAILFLSLCSLVFSSEELQCLDREEISKLFPHIVNFPSNKGTLYFCREIDVGSQERYSCKPTKITTIRELNASYMSFKEANDLSSYSLGVELSFRDGAFYCRDERINLNTFNIFEELRYVVNDDFKLIVTNEYNHACIAGGQYVLSAGVIHFNESGLICYLDNSTGHICSKVHHLQQASRYFWSQGMLDSNCIIRFWDGENNSLANFLTKELPPLEEAVYYPAQETNLSCDSVFSFVPSLEQEKTLAVKILEIRNHQQYIVHLKTHAIPCSKCEGDTEKENKLQAEFDDYNANAPYGDLYEKVERIYNHYYQEQWRKKEVDGKSAHTLTEEEKQNARVQLENLKSQRPCQDLWLLIFGNSLE